MFVDRVTSTQDALRTLADAGAPEGTWIAAREQTAGRGRLGRSWFGASDGLMLSVLLRPELPPGLLGLIPIAAAVAAREALDTRLEIKWPNDLLLPAHLGHRKVAGILAEAEIDGGRVRGVRLGIGVNVRATPDSVVAGCLADLGSLHPSLTNERLAERLVASVLHWTRQVGTDAQGVRAAWEAAAAWRGERLVVSGIAGTWSGLAPDGALGLRGDDGQIVWVRTGDVVRIEGK